MRLVPQTLLDRMGISPVAEFVCVQSVIRFKTEPSQKIRKPDSTKIDEVMASWRLLTPVLDHWKNQKVTDFPNYASGTRGPQAADEMLAREGRMWRLV